VLGSVSPELRVPRTASQISSPHKVHAERRLWRHASPHMHRRAGKGRMRVGDSGRSTRFTNQVMGLIDR